MAAVPGNDLAALRQEVQQLKEAVEVLTSATHLMAIPNPAAQGPHTSGAYHLFISCLSVANYLPDH